MDVEDTWWCVNVMQIPIEVGSCGPLKGLLHFCMCLSEKSDFIAKQKNGLDQTLGGPPQRLTSMRHRPIVFLASLLALGCMFIYWTLTYKISDSSLLSPGPFTPEASCPPTQPKPSIKKAPPQHKVQSGLTYSFVHIIFIVGCLCDEYQRPCES